MGYEGFLLVGPILLLSFVYTILTGQTDQDPPDSMLALAKRLGLQILIVATLVGYFVWGWSKGKVTLPMQTLQLQVIDSQTEGPASRRQALIRALTGFFSLGSGLWLVFALLRQDRQTPHDLISKTRLVYKPRARS